MTKLTKPFRSEANTRYTKQIFFEQWRDLPIEQRVGEPPFTLFLDKEGYINFGKEYVADGDPTGYTTATRLLDGYPHWKQLEKAMWFRAAKAIWDEELDAKLKAEALLKIRELSKGDDAKALQAAKYLANQEYKEKTSKRGRPSKEEVEGKLNEDAEEAKRLREDAERIRLIKG